MRLRLITAVALLCVALGAWAATELPGSPRMWIYFACTAVPLLAAIIATWARFEVKMRDIATDVKHETRGNHALDKKLSANEERQAADMASINRNLEAIWDELKWQRRKVPNNRGGDSNDR